MKGYRKILTGCLAAALVAVGGVAAVALPGSGTAAASVTPALCTYPTNDGLAVTSATVDAEVISRCDQPVTVTLVLWPYPRVGGDPPGPRAPLAVQSVTLANAETATLSVPVSGCQWQADLVQGDAEPPYDGRMLATALSEGLPDCYTPPPPPPPVTVTVTKETPAPPAQTVRELAPPPPAQTVTAPAPPAMTVTVSTPAPAPRTLPRPPALTVTVPGKRLPAPPAKVVTKWRSSPPRLVVRFRTPSTVTSRIHELEREVRRLKARKPEVIYRACPVRGKG